MLIFVPPKPSNALRDGQQFQLYYQNVRGLRSKLHEFRTATAATDFDCIVLTETWLNNDFAPSEIFSANYCVHRKDRQYEQLSCSRGGGSLIAVRNCFKTIDLPSSNSLLFDDVWSEIILMERNPLIVCGVYFPPCSISDAYDEFATTVERYKAKFENSRFIIAGDFNLPDIQWQFDECVMFPLIISPKRAENFIESFTYMELFQRNGISNIQNRILDLIFSDYSTEFTVMGSEEILSKIDALHPPLVISFQTVLDTEYIEDYPEVYNFSKANYNDLNHFLYSLDWSFLHTCSNVDDVVEQFYEKLFIAIELYVPKFAYKVDRYPQWYSEECKRILSLKRKLYRKYRRSGDPSDYAEYSRARKESKLHIDMSFAMFAAHTEHLVPSNIKSFWAYLNKLNNDGKLPCPMFSGDDILDSEQAIADSFANYFESCYIDHSNVVLGDFDKSVSSGTLSSHHFTDEEIEIKLHTLDCNKKSGPDGIPPIFLNKCCSILTPLLRQIYQLTFDHGTFPKCWKHSVLFPVFKSGNRNSIQNYRGISLLSIIPKILESIITDEVFWNIRALIAPQQHGFYKGRSTTTNLAVFQEYTMSSLESGFQVDAVYTDLAKAFDSVCHILLLKKLENYGISGSYLSWISSYLNGRTQYVRIGSHCSRHIKVSSGVPQGSHLGPVLFIVFINDVISCFVHSECLLYADDLKLFARVSSDNDCALIQQDLNSFVMWCCRNFLSINIRKCEVMRFYRCQNPTSYDYCISSAVIETAEYVIDLGITFDRKLSFTVHIDKIVLKALRMLGFIKRNTRMFNDLAAIMTLYKSLVISVLEYNCIIWSPVYACHVDRLERVQSRFVRFALWKLGYPYRNVERSVRLTLLGLRSLEYRRQCASVKFLHGLISGSIDCAYLLGRICLKIPTRTTRNTELFYVSAHRVNYGFQIITVRLAQLYNDKFSVIDIFSTGTDQLKHALLYHVD